MKIAFVPKDETACAYYRIVLPAIALAQKGYQAVISTKENDFIPYANSKNSAFFWVFNVCQ